MRHIFRLFAVLALLAFPATAGASELVAHNVKNPTLKVDRKGNAMVSYTLKGRKWNVLYWGAINSSHNFRYDRSGGWKSKRANFKTFRDACGKYDGPALPYLVKACKAPDGSYWALQNWARIKPNYGGAKGAKEIRISHWTGELANFWIKTDWSWAGQWEHLYGQLTYKAKPIFPRKQWGSLGQCMQDPHCRNLSIESLDSDYPGSRGWRRINMFLAHAPNGQFCFGISPKGGSPYSGRSKIGKYRAQVNGPYVTPDLEIYFNGPGKYDKALDEVFNQEQLALRGGNLNSNCAKIN